MAEICDRLRDSDQFPAYDVDKVRRALQPPVEVPEVFDDELDDVVAGALENANNAEDLLIPSGRLKRVLLPFSPTLPQEHYFQEKQDYYDLIRTRSYAITDSNGRVSQKQFSDDEAVLMTDLFWGIIGSRGAQVLQGILTRAREHPESSGISKSMAYRNAAVEHLNIGQARYLFAEMTMVSEIISSASRDYVQNLMVNVSGARRAEHSRDVANLLRADSNLGMVEMPAC